jgi:hypothetical protein
MIKEAVKVNLENVFYVINKQTIIVKIKWFQFVHFNASINLNKFLITKTLMIILI